MSKAPAKIDVGSSLGPNLTVLGIVDDRRTEPLYLVWHHKSWCPMLCKVFRFEEATRREADILLALAHPNVVRCFGVDGSTRLLMEYLEGPSLHQVARAQPKRRLDISDALRIAIYVGSALSHVHDRGFLHLDVKPSNIVVMGGRPVLYDFDTARPQAAPRPNSVRGTGGYIAPEECLLQQITPAVDIFGLGVTLYELLTGRMPFPEKTDDEPFPQISQAPTPVRRYRPAVSGGLEGLVLSCLAREPKVRPGLAALLPALHGHITRGPKMWPTGFHPEMQASGRTEPMP